MNWLNNLFLGKTKPEVTSMGTPISSLRVKGELPAKTPVKLPPKKLNFQVTLSPSFDHFPKFSKDRRLNGIRLNSAMMHLDELDKELEIVKNLKNPVDLYFDIKGRQLRIQEVDIHPDHLEVVLNHPIEVETPTIVLFKAGSDRAMLDRVVDGKRLIFAGGPNFMVKPGESIHIRNPSLRLKGPVFCDYEIQKIEKVRKAGINKYFLSYVEAQTDIDQFRELIGKDAFVVAKIETKAGLDYVASQFKKKDNLSLMAARGDLYVEVDMPHDILSGVKFIAQKDPNAYVGSRILLSLVQTPVPECCDFSDLAWLYDVGYRNMMLCDEICLKPDLLSTAINVLDAFRDSYKGDGE
jgi:pyruvate kinase